jgi:hypothetical protein
VQRHRLLATIAIAAALAIPCNAAADDFAADHTRIRRALAAPTALRDATTRATGQPRRQVQRARVVSGQRDSITNGLLIGAAAGGAGGYISARQQCGGNDAECAAIVNPVGICVGAAIGAAVGAILDAFSD